MLISVIKNNIVVCNSCHTTSDKSDIKTIRIVGDNSIGGIAIMLCRNCRKKLIKVLEDCNKKEIDSI